MPDITAIAQELVEVDGVVAVLLGGSRARGTHRPDSDWDLGVYYREPLDLAALRRLATSITGEETDVAGPGGWGPWVNGGAWLRTRDGESVDFILRDTDRVRSVWDDCRAGRYETGTQPGHPLGFFSPVYAGEVALGRILADPTGELTALRAETADYPQALRTGLYAGTLWEAGFSLTVAAKAPHDTLYVSLCLSRCVGLLTQALHAHAGVWCLNEKGALTAAAALPAAPPDFAARAAAALSTLSPAAARDLVAEVEALGAPTADRNPRTL
ncbi:nucleotidyltransferase domain-containing protein [Streptomyces sp. NPDC051940]|uniref:nucleotidyltransferase domain-containing protein n=1 Tax=Streptomyces sp. NPDC051940 TaxID=3155675 RepID=UPI003447913E